MLEQYLVRMFVTAGEALAGDAEMRTEINQGLVAVLRTVVAEQKSGVSTFISDQVKSWDMGQLISLIEINIGRDLQYIRFNGSLIGGLAGWRSTRSNTCCGCCDQLITSTLLVIPGQYSAGLQDENRFPNFLWNHVALRNNFAAFAST